MKFSLLSLITYILINKINATEHAPFDQDGLFVVYGSRDTKMARVLPFLQLDPVESFKSHTHYFRPKQNDNITNSTNNDTTISMTINNAGSNTLLASTPSLSSTINTTLNKNISNETQEIEYVQFELPSWNLPLVVVAIPTFNRREFLFQSLEYVKWQQYPRDRIHVAILDDSPISFFEDNDDFRMLIKSLEHVGIQVHYKHRTLINNQQENIGQKRNSLTRWIKYDIPMIDERDYVIVHWDDDDWHAPHRIIKQVLPLINGQSKLTALDLRTILVLHENKLYYRWAPEGRNLSNAMPIMSVNGGTLAYWVSIFDETNGLTFPNLGCGEDIMFVDRVVNAHYRVTILDDSDISVIYMRHKGNTWGGLDSASWSLLKDELLPPRFVQVSDFYKSMQTWNKPYWNGKIKDSEEMWICSKNIDEIKNLVVNEIRGLY